MKKAGNTPDDRPATLKKPETSLFFNGVCEACHLAVLICECTHGNVETGAQASKHLGAQKSLELLSGEHVLMDLRAEHRAHQSTALSSVGEPDLVEPKRKAPQARSICIIELTKGNWGQQAVHRHP